MDILFETLLTVLQPVNILVLLGGVLGGMLIGAIPGMTVTMAVALAVPFTLTMGPVPSLLMLLGIYCAGIYGGSITAILLNAPGTPASAATSLDGYELAKQGKAGKALKMALLASVYGGLFSIVVLVLVAPQLAEFAPQFGPPEIATLLIFSLTMVGVLSGETIVKGLLAASIGMIIAVIGADPMLSVDRFTFGAMDLFDGVPYIPLLIGLFAMAEMLAQAETAFRQSGQVISLEGTEKDSNRITRDDMRRCTVPMIRSGFLGVFIGMLPGLGAGIATFLGYAESKRASKEPERFGKGAIEGVAASEAANNAVTGATLVPLLALSIPGDVITAILLGALLIQGVTPGPMIFLTNIDIVYTVYIALLLANLAVAATAMIAIRPMLTVLKVPKAVLYPVIFMICVAGSYAIRNNLFDVFIMFAGGVLGYILRLFGLPLAPLLIAFILTRPFEEAMRQALIASEGDLSIFVTRPIAAFFVVLTVLAIAFTIRRHMRGNAAIPDAG